MLPGAAAEKQHHLLFKAHAGLSGVAASDLVGLQDHRKDYLVVYFLRCWSPPFLCLFSLCCFLHTSLPFFLCAYFPHFSFSFPCLYISMPSILFLFLFDAKLNHLFVVPLFAQCRLSSLHVCSVCHGRAELSGVSAARSACLGQRPHSQTHARPLGSRQIYACSGKYAASVLSIHFSCPS